MIRSLTITLALAIIFLANVAQSQDMMGFDRESFGSVVLSRTQAAGTDSQLELSIGNYENEPIINYSVGSVFAQIGRSVGRLDVLTDKGLFPCTAFIVSKKYILTNYHCSLGLLDNTNIGATRIDGTQFVAGYTQTGIEEGTKKYTVIPTPVETSKPLDYAVLEVLGDPSEEYGQLKLASITPNNGDPFWIIGHPMGEGQRISREKCKANNPALSAGKLLHTCDTLPGNSGSPVIDAGLQQVVALHHAGSQKDSVNFAILMSEILENSKVLTAYKAPEALPTVTPEPPKIAEITPCDALYSAAAEAKACFAYEAYFKSCRDHSLAPIADGYINEFCQVEETVKVDEAPKNAEVTKTCSQKNSEVCSTQKVCSMATLPNGGSKKWDLGSWAVNYVKEAKRRGLTCGVEAKTASAKQVCTRLKPDGCTNEFLCKASIKGSDKKYWLTNTYVTEAKKRGLTCGVQKRKLTHSEVAIKAHQNLCPASGIGASCFGTFTDSDGNKWIGRQVNRKFHGLFTHVSLADNKWKGDVRIGCHSRNSADWCGPVLYVWHKGQARFWSNYEHGKSYNSNSTVNEVFPSLRRMFNALSKQNRITIQRSLSKKGLYSSSIDGAWGKNTLIGLARFAVDHLNTVNLKSTDNIELLLRAAKDQSYSQRTQIASLSILEEVAKRDASATNVAAKSPNFKGLYRGQSTLKRKQLQYALKKLGFYSSSVDGLWGKGTSSAIVEYAQSNGVGGNSPSSVFSSILSKVDVESPFESPAVKCHNDPKTCSTTLLCSKARSLPPPYKWETKTRYLKHVAEAKRRGLQCGVEAKKNIPVAVVNKATKIAICAGTAWFSSGLLAVCDDVFD